MEKWLCIYKNNSLKVRMWTQSARAVFLSVCIFLLGQQFVGLSGSYAAQNSSVQDPPYSACQNLLNGGSIQSLGNILDNQLGELILQYVVTIERKREAIDRLAAGGNPSLYSDAAFLQEYYLYQRFMEDVFITLKNIDEDKGLEQELEEMRKADPEDKSWGELLSEHRRKLHALIRTLEVQKEDFFVSLARGLLTPGDVVILEIKKPQDQGGQSDKIREIANMYVQYSQSRGWRVQQLSGDVKSDDSTYHYVLRIQGRGVPALLGLEEGLHRIEYFAENPRAQSRSNRQRIHTARIEVLAYPEPEIEAFHFDRSEVRIETSRSSGAGGQNVNRRDTAVRAVHEPTGIDVRIENQRSQHQNIEEALAALRAKVYARYQEEVREMRSRARNQNGDTVHYVRNYDLTSGQRQVMEMLEGNLDAAIREAIRAALVFELPLRIAEVEASMRE